MHRSSSPHSPPHQPPTRPSTMASAGVAVVTPSRTSAGGGLASPARAREVRPPKPVLHSYLQARALAETAKSPLLRKTRTRDHHGLKKLLDEVPPVDVDYRGMTPLHHAAALGDLPAMKLILKKADKSALEKKDRCGSTPLHHAALLDHPKAVQLLLRAGSNINAQKSNGRTPLHEAAWIGHLNVLEVLIQAGADPEILEANHRTAAQIARLNHADPAAERIEAYIKHIADEEYAAELERRKGEWWGSFKKATAKRRDCGRSRKKRVEPTPEELEERERRKQQRQAAKERRRLREEQTKSRELWLEEQRKLAAGLVIGDHHSSRSSSVCSYAMSDSDLSARGLKRGTFTCHCPYCTTWRRAQETNEWDKRAAAQLG